jgi:hypothetical protein
MSSNIPYTEIKQWYLDNKDSLQKTMGNNYMVILDTHHAFEMNIAEMDHHIEKHGSKANSISVARSCYHRLMNLYIMANNPETHNKGKLIKYGDPEWMPVTPSKIWKAPTK